MTNPFVDPQEVLSEALRAVNGIRQGLGREPLDQLPTGFRRDPFHCPVANALSNGGKAAVTITVEVFDEEGLLVYCKTAPPPLTRFMAWFDNGVFPELER